jgi:arylsulfatase A-like enzyme
LTRRAFGSQLAVTALSVLAGALAEAAVSAGRAGAAQGSLGAALWCGVWTLGLWALPAALLALALAWLLAVVCDEESLGEALRLAWAEPSRRDALLVGMFAAPLLLGLVFFEARAVARFHNVELGAALVALLVLASLLLVGVVGFAGFRALGRRRAAGRALGVLPWLALLFKVAVVAGLLLECRAGLLQLDARLLAAPLAFAATFGLLDRWGGARGRVVSVLGGSAGVLLLTWLVFLLGGARSSAVVATHGAWSRPLIAGVQALTDFDRDGYSGFLGGGDCAPFDATINPGAAEIAGDGVDNNCIGGDAGKASEPHRPSWGASAHGSPRNLDVVVVTIEALRRDHASFVGAARDTTPTLRSLAPESLVFERMYSAAPLTRLSVASLFSSYAPSEIEWLPQDPSKRMRHIGARTPWLPEMLRARGYETIAVLSDFSAFTSQESAGFERGFDHYDVSTKLEYRGGTMWGFPAAEQVDKALGYVRAARRPFLLWLHLFEPHYRYEQPPDAPLFGADDQARYDAEIWHADHELGRLIAGLREQGAWNDTVLFVSGDHGEAFGEHQDRWHGSNLFDPQLRPAALLRVPGVTGKRLGMSVTFTDVAPTIARILGDRQTFDQLRGRSLAPLFHHPQLPEGENSFVTESFSVEDGHAYQAALVAYPLKLIYVEDGHRFSLFDLASDPSEQNPIDPQSDPRAAPLLQELIGYLERTHSRALAPLPPKP